MPWKLKVGEQSILLDDLSQDDLHDATIEVVDGMRRAIPGVTWLTMYQRPAENPGAFYALVVAVAKRLGEPVPERPANAKAMVTFLVEHVEHVEDDDLPTEFHPESGVPLEEVDPETTTSSTSTEPEDGPPSKPADTP